MCASWSIGSTGTRWGFCIPLPAPQQPCLAGTVDFINQSINLSAPSPRQYYWMCCVLSGVKRDKYAEVDMSRT